MDVYYKKNTGFIGVPKLGKLKLEFIVPYRFDVNYLDENGDLSNKTLVYCRFHSSKEIAEKSSEELEKTQGFHARTYDYNGIDKTEAQLIEWLFDTPNLKPTNGNNINIKDATKV